MAITFNGTELDVENSQIFNLSDVDTITFNGTTVFEKNAAPAWDNRGLEYNSWSTIQYYISQGDISGKIAVGNTKTVSINGTTYTMRVVSINSGTGSAATYYPAKTVDFVSDNGFTRRMGPNSSIRNWRNSSVRSYLNGDFYNAMPTELKNAIVSKTHVRVNGSSQYETDSDKVWLFTAYEFGFTYYDNVSSNSTKERASDNIKYPYYTSTIRGNLADVRIWTSSKTPTDSDAFFARNSKANDYISSWNEYNTWKCLPGFRIG